MQLVSISKLKSEGYSEQMLRELAHKEVFKEIGYRNKKSRSKIFFFWEKLDNYLADEMERR